MLIELLDRVYAALATPRGVTRGHNVVMYGAHGHMIAGVEVGPGFTAADGVDAAATPAGTAVTVAHVGPYARLGATHAAIRAWCREQGLAASAISWEVYGDWAEDESRLRTDVYVLLVD